MSTFDKVHRVKHVQLWQRCRWATNRRQIDDKVKSRLSTLSPVCTGPKCYNRQNVDDTRRSSSDRCQSQIGLLVENRNFAPVRGSRRNIAITFGMEKLELCGYRGEKKLKICLFVSTESTNVTDGRTDTQTDTA